MAIAAEEFINAARKRGFSWYTGVPCSFLTPFINYVIDDPQLTYISSANEGDAVATAAGVTMGGQRGVVMMQNSGLGNAVNPLTSLTYPFRIPLLLICTLRGDPNLKDEPQHQLMGRITPNLLEAMEIPWEYFPTETPACEFALDRADTHLKRKSRPYALIMRKGTIKSEIDHQLAGIRVKPQTDSYQAGFFQEEGQKRVSRHQALGRIVQQTNPQDTVIIATTGYTGRELFASWDRSNHLYLVGSMGCGSSLGLGLSLACPHLKVVVIDGDGAALMRMGNFATIGAYGGENFIHILLDNEVHDSTGGQATVSPGVSFAQIAIACGYGTALFGDDLYLIDALLAADADSRPRFAHLKICPGVIPNLPRPTLSPPEVWQRLMNQIKATSLSEL